MDVTTYPTVLMTVRRRCPRRDDDEGDGFELGWHLATNHVGPFQPMRTSSTGQIIVQCGECARQVYLDLPTVPRIP